MNILELNKATSLSMVQKKGTKTKVVDLTLALDKEKKSELIKFICNPRISKRKNYLVFSAKISVSEEELENYEFGLHWGKIGEAWVDQFFIADEITLKNRYVELVKAVNPTASGQYGLTLFVRSLKTGERIWLSDFGIPNQRFDISAPFVSPLTTSAKKAVAVVDEIVSISQTLDNLRDLESFARFLIDQSRSKGSNNFNNALFEIVKNDSQLKARIEEFAVQILTAPNGLNKNEALRALAVLRSIGLSEVLFVSPEGPNANVGGLAQVIKGLSQALSHKKINVTLVVPFFEDANGSKHDSAENIISNGLDLFGKKVKLKKYGNLRFSLGHTRDSANGSLKTPREMLEVHVYRAVKGNIRIFLLRNKRYAKKLYNFSGADDQLRQAMFLSKASIELIRNPMFEVSPQIVVSNDWLTALVPALLKTDKEYLKSRKLKNIKSCHIIHNAGRAYQGRLYVNQYNEDLWPILGLEDQHFFGLQDAEDPSQLNLTRGAIFHSDSIVTVSKPYAEQLLTSEGGEGLDSILNEKRNVLFGISNGVDLTAIQKALWKNIEKENEIGKFSSFAFSTKLDSLKAFSKLSIQKRYGLPINIDKKIISLVGRITEQKGVGLLVSKIRSTNETLLESILKKGTQVIIAGPTDRSSQKVCQALEIIQKKYPDQLKLIFEYVPHNLAMEITHASDVFLMPSKYEPGGITQLEALISGALVVARNVGGLKATLSNIDLINHTGNAFLFEDFTAEEFSKSLYSALDYLNNNKRLNSLRLRNARSKNDWLDRIESYFAIFQNQLGALDLSFLADRKKHLSSLRT